jgi:hypothetical protein
LDDTGYEDVRTLLVVAGEHPSGRLSSFVCDDIVSMKPEHRGHDLRRAVGSCSLCRPTDSDSFVPCG